MSHLLFGKVQNFLNLQKKSHNTIEERMEYFWKTKTEMSRTRNCKDVCIVFFTNLEFRIVWIRSVCAESLTQPVQLIMRSGLHPRWPPALTLSKQILKNFSKTTILKTKNTRTNQHLDTTNRNDLVRTLSLITRIGFFCPQLSWWIQKRISGWKLKFPQLPVTPTLNWEPSTKMEQNKQKQVENIFCCEKHVFCC